MIVNVWLKSQPNKKVPYPDCYHLIEPNQEGISDLKTNKVIILDKKDSYVVAEYAMEAIQRVEFRL